MTPFIPPEFKAEAFNCPYCNAYAHQTWDYSLYFKSYKQTTLNLSLCSHCHNVAVWNKDQLILPMVSPAPLPNPDMSAKAQEYYEEARAVYPHSKRAAAALLRLSLQELCIQLGAAKQNLNDSVKFLAQKGLRQSIIDSLDTLRVIGNYAVHPEAPGTIDLEDDFDISQLFWLINFIADDLITKEKYAADLLSKIPERDKEAIKKRDKKKL